METKNTEITIQLSEEQKAIVVHKKNKWAQLGVNFAISEMEIQNDVDNLLKRIKMPESIEDVPAAEATLKNLTSEYNRIVKRRIDSVAVLSVYLNKRMDPEKSCQQPMTDFRNKIIVLKKEYEEKKQAVDNKNKEIVQVKEYLLNQANIFDANCKTKITKMVAAGYTHALTLVDGKPRVNTLDNLELHLEVCRGKFTAKDFIFDPVKPTVKHINEEEYAEMVADINLPTDYVALYLDEVKSKYSDYEVAVLNATVSLEANKKEVAEKAAVINTDLTNKTIAAKLEASVTPPPVVLVPGVKALKKTFVINLPENMENAMIILSAFITNYKQASGLLGIKKAFNLSIGNMITVLEKIKNNDNAFEFTGIIWEEVSK